MCANPLLVDASLFDKQLRGTQQEGEIAAHADQVRAFADRGAQYSRYRVRRNPIRIEPRLAIGIDRDDARSTPARLGQVLHGHRLVVGRIRAEEDNQVRLKEVGVAAAGGCIAQRGLQPSATRGVAQAR